MNQKTRSRIWLSDNRNTLRSPKKKTTIECSPNMLSCIWDNSFTKDTIVTGFDNKIIIPVIGENYIEYTF